jgi:deglycase
MAALKDMTVAVLATDGFEERELTEPVKALRDAGATVDIIAPKAGEIQAFKHHDKSIKVKVDKTLDQVRADDYDAVLLPGGALNADAMRVEPKARQFLQAMQQDRKPFAIICHAPWEVVSAGLVPGRTMTSYHTIQDDLRNAGARWVDQEVVVDANWVMSRQPDDIPAFNREMLALFESHQPARR